MNSVKHHQHPLLIIKIYKLFYLLQRYNSKMSSIERANHQHPLPIIKTLYSLYLYSVYFKDVKYRKGKSSTPNT